MYLYLLAPSRAAIGPTSRGCGNSKPRAATVVGSFLAPGLMTAVRVATSHPVRDSSDSCTVAVVFPRLPNKLDFTSYMALSAPRISHPASSYRQWRFIDVNLSISQQDG
jgi:hypothetical protein